MKFYEIVEKCICKVLEWGKFSWIVDQENDFGFKIFGVKFIYYKWPDTAIVITTKKRVDGNMNFRVVKKRELDDTKNIAF